MISLRPYQQEFLEAAWACLFSEPNVLGVLPTGAGKTRAFAALCERAISVKSEIKILILMGRVDLVNQTERVLKEFFGASQVGVFCASLNRKETHRSITLASIQSLKELHKVDLIIVDEVHRMDQEEGAYIRMIEGCRDKNIKLKVLGVTATPYRSTGLIYGRGQLFERICYRKSIPEMIQLGYLASPIMKSGTGDTCHNISGLRLRGGEYIQEDVDALVADQKRCEEQVKDALQHLKDRECVVWATANINHCNMVADTLMALGERCTTVHSKLKKDDRNNNLGAFMSGSMRHMSFVSILSEGFDHPPIDAIVLMRPMRSPVLYVQTVGRGLRPSEGKTSCLVLDYGQVVETIGPIDDPSIAKGGGQRERDGQLKLVSDPVQFKCKNCNTFTRAPAKNCSACGEVFPEPPRSVFSDKLSQQAGRGSILSSERPPPEPEKRILGPIIVSLHEAKSGNQCVKLQYVDRAIVTRWGPGGVSEFFVQNNAWAMERLEHRLDQIGYTGILTDPPDEIIEGTFEVVTVQEGKYDRVKSVRRLSDENPGKESNIGFGDDAEEDASFDFGFNSNSPEEIGF